MRLILSAESSVESLLRGPLNAAGFQLDTVQSADGMVALAGVAPRPDAILASVPSAADGMALFWELKARLAEAALPVVLIVMVGTDADAEKLTKVGAAGVFLAPVNGGRLLRRLKELAGAAPAKPAAPLAKPAAPAPPPSASAQAAPAAPPAAPVAAPNPFAGLAQATHALPSSDEIASAMEADQRAAQPRNEQLEAMLGMDVDMRSLPGRRIDLNSLMTRGHAPKIADEAVIEVPINMESIAPPVSIDLSGPVRWPANLPSLEQGAAVLTARTLGAPLMPGADEVIVAETWKALTNAEIDALKSVGTPGKQPPPTESELSLTRIASERFRVRTALVQAERLIQAGATVDVDDAFVAACQQDITAAIKDSLDPILQWAVAQGQLELMKQFRSVREALLQRGQDIERAAARLRGLEQERVLNVRLDASMAPAVKKPLSGRFKTRLLEISTVTAQSVRDNAPMLIRVMVVLGIISAGLHLFVFDSLGLRHRPQKVEKSVPILGVQKIEFFEGMETATVNSSFDMTAGLKELARTAQPGTTLVLVDAETLRPITTVGRDRLQEVASMEVEGLAENEAPSRPTAATATHAPPPPGTPAAAPPVAAPAGAHAPVAPSVPPATPPAK